MQTAHRLFGRAVLPVLACLALTLTAGNASAALVWHSPLDGDATALVGNDGVPSGLPTPTADKNGNLGGAVDFGAGSSFYEIDANPEITSLTAGSISAWVRWNNSGGEQGVVAVGESGGGATNYFTFMRQNNTTIRADLDDGGTRRDAAQGGLSDSTWYHTAVTFADGGTLRLYIDGVEEDTQGLPASSYTGLDTWLIGTERTGSRFLNGALDDVRIYDHELSAGDVANLFNAGPLTIPGPPPPPMVMGPNILSNPGFDGPTTTIGDTTQDVDNHGAASTWLLVDDGGGGGGDQWRVDGSTAFLAQASSSEAQALLQWVQDNQTTTGSGKLSFDILFEDDSTNAGEVDLRVYVFGWDNGDTVPRIDSQNGNVGAGDEFDLLDGMRLDGFTGDAALVLIENNVALHPDITADVLSQVEISVDFGLGKDNVAVLFYGEAQDGSSFRIDNVFLGDLRPAPVPEPATFSLLALGGLAALRRRRRRA